jgi:hypothetical protein
MMNGTSTATTTLNEYHPEVGGHISRQKDNSSVIVQKAITKPMTRPEVEEALQD